MRAQARVVALVALIAISSAASVRGWAVAQGPPPITVESRADRLIVAISSGFDVALEAPLGTLVRVLEDARGVPAACTPLVGATVRCDAFALGSTSGHVIVALVDSATEQIPLPTGCSNVTLTFALATPLAEVGAALLRPSVLVAIWKAANGRFRGFAPGIAAAITDYERQETPLEPVFLCVNDATTLLRPAPAARPAVDGERSASTSSP